MGQDKYLSLLGLALRGGHLAAGADAVEAAARGKHARLILLSAGVSDHVRRHGAWLAESGKCLLVSLPCSKEELGHALGRETAVIAAVTDTGLALAVGERLAALDPEQYAETAARLRVKARRAGERRILRQNRDPARKRGPQKHGQSRRPSKRGKPGFPHQ